MWEDVLAGSSTSGGDITLKAREDGWGQESVDAQLEAALLASCQESTSAVRCLLHLRLTWRGRGMAACGNNRSACNCARNVRNVCCSVRSVAVVCLVRPQGNCVQGGAEDEDADLAAAIAASLADSQGGHTPASIRETPGSAFTFRSVSPTNTHQCRGSVAACSEPDGRQPSSGGASDTVFVSKGIAAVDVRETVTDASQGVCEVAVKLPNNQRVIAKFGLAQPLAHVVAWIAVQGWDVQKHRLSLAYPKQALTDSSKSLKEAGIRGPREMLILALAPAAQR